MSDDFKKLARELERLADDIPKIMNELAVGEGANVVKIAKRITNDEQIYRTRNYKRSFHSDDKARVAGDTYFVNAGNTAEYAEYIEKGFKRHFVPGHWEGDIFVYDHNEKTGAVFGPMQGRWVMKRAAEETEATQQARLERKLNKKLNKKLKEYFK